MNAPDGVPRVSSGRFGWAYTTTISVAMKEGTAEASRPDQPGTSASAVEEGHRRQTRLRRGGPLAPRRSRPTNHGLDSAVAMCALEGCWGIPLTHRGWPIEGVSVLVRPATRDLEQVRITAGAALGVQGG